MKIKVFIGIALVCSSVATPSFAWNYMDENNRNKESNRGHESKRGHESNRGYESSFGNKYEYDLSRPGDRIRYSVDPGAQLRDSIDVNPTRELERGLGQYGGGAYRD